MADKIINVAIDGPAGAGKSTIAKMVAEKLKFLYVDTGAMYRAFALACLRQKLKPEEETKIIEVCEKSTVSIEYQDGVQIVLLDGENVNGLIRTEEVSRMTSPVSAYPAVRAKLLDLQRNLALVNSVIMDGRDIGSNVLPNANPKIYLTASVKTRAMRRYKEQIEKGNACTLEDIEADIEARDKRDTQRECAPLTVAKGAVILDSSDMNIHEVVEKVIEIIHNANP